MRRSPARSDAARSGRTWPAIDVGLGDAFINVISRTTQESPDERTFPEAATEFLEDLQVIREERQRRVELDQLLEGFGGAADTFVRDPATGVPRPLGPVARARLESGVQRSLAAPRSFDPQPGEVLPNPAPGVSTTAAWPLTPSAQVPILAGSRDDPFGFVIPFRRPAFGGSPGRAGFRGVFA